MAMEQHPMITWVERDVRSFLKTVGGSYGTGDPLRLVDVLKSTADQTRGIATRSRELAIKTQVLELERAIPGIQVTEDRLARRATQLADADFHLYQTLQHVAHNVKGSRRQLRSINRALSANIEEAKENGDIVTLIAKAHAAIDKAFQLLEDSLDLCSRVCDELHGIADMYSSADRPAAPPA